MLIVAPADDSHARSVLRAFGARHVAATAASLESFRFCRLTWYSPSQVEIGVGPRKWTLNERTAVWWRRPGVVKTGGLRPEEAQLVAAETRAAFVGALMAANVRWLDRPDVIQVAESKPLQLSVARKLGLSTPRTIVTNRVGDARSFAARPFGVVAKCLSSGPGLAPFVDVIEDEMLGAAAAAPVLMQELLASTADIRIVTIDGVAFQWIRPRSPGDAIDWRRADPSGKSFETYKDKALDRAALKLARALQLRFSVQDWALVHDSPVFLEVNPQGNWIFLKGARKAVAPSIASCLRSNSRA